MARLVEPHASIGHVVNSESSKSKSKDVFDSPNVVDNSQQMGSTGGMARARRPVDTTERCHNGANVGPAYERNPNTLISAWRTSLGHEASDSPIERAKARLASWYVSSPLSVYIILL